MSKAASKGQTFFGTRLAPDHYKILQYMYLNKNYTTEHINVKGEVNTKKIFFVTVQVKPKYYKKIKVTSHLPFVRSENTLFCSTKSSIFNKMHLL